MSEQQAEYKIDNRPSTIFRTIKNKDNPYVMIDQRPILNPKLSFKAKGILAYLVSRPDGWECNLVDLSKRSCDGLASVKGGIKELKDAGHIIMERTRLQDGTLGTVLWKVYETPQVDNRLMDTPDMVDASPQVDYPQVDKPQVDNRTQVILKDLSNKEISSREEEILKTATSTSPKGLSLESYSLKVFISVTGMMAIPAKDREDALMAIEALRNKFETIEEVIYYLIPFWNEWFRRGYRRTNLSWLTEWSVTGEIPKDSKPIDGMSDIERELIKRGYKSASDVRSEYGTQENK